MGTMIRDPRVRQTLNQISDNIESVTDTAKVGCFSFTKSYLEPCINSIASVCPAPETVCPCFYHDPSISRRRRRAGGNPEFAFEFYNSDYDDYYAPEDPLRWGNDELDRLLAGSGVVGRRRKAGERNEGMYYTRGGQRVLRQDGRRKSGLTRDGEQDPTIIPNTAALGFLSYFPWVRKRQQLRYKPSAADLQDHPGGYGGVGGEFRENDEVEETEALLGVRRGSSDSNERGGRRSRSRRRGRSGTTSSGDTTDTFRSRADLFPSEDEDDAVPLDDEFEINLEPDSASGRRSKRGPRRRPTGDTTSSGLSGNGSLGSPAQGGRKTPASDEYRIEDDIDIDDDAREIDLVSPGFSRRRSEEELRREEEANRREEEQASEMRREAAKRLALSRGPSIEGPVRTAHSRFPTIEY
ncbi:hypothetical protein AA313_de0205825 [Arthrobotrys entomopaga]|nr:hypothetical protein AA313_de0205825 [Arthrobotrys entomopaga]